MSYLIQSSNIGMVYGLTSSADVEEMREKIRAELQQELTDKAKAEDERRVREQADLIANGKAMGAANLATHDYSDPYCAYRDRGELIAFCKNCGYSRHHASMGSCVPSPGWRLGFEKRAASAMFQMGKSFGVYDRIAVPDSPRQSVTSSGALIGVWSLRDEG